MNKPHVKYQFFDFKNDKIFFPPLNLIEKFYPKFLSECFIFPVILKSFIKHNLAIKYILAEVPGHFPLYFKNNWTKKFGFKKMELGKESNLEKKI